MLSFCSTLTEALDRCKRKYQAKLRKTEQQMIAVMRGGGEIREEGNPVSGKQSSSQSGDQPKNPKTSSSKIPLPRLEGKAL